MSESPHSDVLPFRSHRASRGRLTRLPQPRLDASARIEAFARWIEEGAGLRRGRGAEAEEGPQEGRPALELPEDENGGGEGVTRHRILPAREARHADWPAGIPPALRAACARRGIEQPYTHQAKAMELALAGKDVVVVTPTASGKSLCYAAPLIARCLEDADARALLLFPTKALSLDQSDALRELVDDVRWEQGEEAVDIPVSTFDGDTPAETRRAVRKRARLVVTNPDMLHAGLLPQHARWSGLFEGLTHVVIDEVHAYRGLFGSHVANVLRRLLRIAHFHGSSPRFIACSATIANPREHVEALVGRSVEMVDDDGAPRGQRHFIVYNPPVINASLGVRASALGSTRRIAGRSIQGGLATITFATSRLSVEILTRYMKDDLSRRGQAPGRVEAYRGGHLPGVRRTTQRRLKEGDLAGVVATSALELGLDIGGLDVAVLCGYPGTIASTWQQAGRAGRRGAASASVLVARATALDQFVAQHPEYLLDSSPEHARIDPDNLLVQADHVKCAAFELPFTTSEHYGALTGEQTQDLLGFLAEDGLLQKDASTWHWTHETHPAGAISLRAVSSDNFVVIDQSDPQRRVIAEVDFPSAPTMLHEKAIHLVGAKQFQVEHLDYEGRKAYVRPVECDYFTDAMTHRTVTVLESFASVGLPLSAVPADAVLMHQGELKVARKVVGFKKIKLYTMENLGYGDVVLPEHEMHATGVWLTLRGPATLALALQGLSRRQIVEGLSGAAHALHAMASLLVMCDARDLETALGDADGTSGAAPGWFLREGRAGLIATTADHEELPLDLEALERFEPSVFLYETVPGGTGLASLLFERRSLLIEGARALVRDCACRAGCPACVGPAVESGAEAQAHARQILALVADCLAASHAGSDAE